MNKYIINIMESEKQHAGSKAKTDINYYLHDLGYLNINIDREVGKLEKYLFANSNINNKLSDLNQGDLVVIQYPLYMGSPYFYLVLRKLFKKKVRTILILHDVISLRESPENKIAVAKEIRLLNKFDVIISHNKNMTAWLRKYGLTNRVVDLELFDYYTQEPIQLEQSEKVVFAGNLNKSNFLTLLGETSIDFLLFGLNSDKQLPENMDYRGAYPPDILPKYLTGSYGLVWDGDSINTCSGTFGNYLQYNNPHKASLYICSGLPLIVWSRSALASFVKNNNVGLALSSLEDLGRVLSSIGKNDYELMKKNAISISEKVRNGFFIKKAISSCEKFLIENSKQ